MNVFEIITSTMNISNHLDTIWSNVIHIDLGYCYTFNFHKIKDLKYFSMADLNDNPSIGFEVNDGL